MSGRVCVWLGGAAGLGANGTPANADWLVEGTDLDEQLGFSVSTAGDVNVDGYPDLIVGAPEVATNDGLDIGHAYVYRGSNTGLGALPAATRTSGQADDDFGYSVATAGDVNGDGRADVMVGARIHDAPEVSEGKAFLYLGTVSTISGTPDWTAEGDQATAYFGTSVATAGDVNGDGYSDILVGAPGFDVALDDAGGAFLYYGASSGLRAAFSWSEDGDQDNAAFGACVASAGDVNGDGYSDLIVGAPRFDTGAVDGGKVFVYHGSRSGLVVPAAWTKVSDQGNGRFGASVAGAGDVNGDGYSDVVIGANLYDFNVPDEGRAWVYRGSATGLRPNHIWSANGGQADARFGSSVAGAGDVNGDGYADIIVGAEQYDGDLVDEGRVFVYQGTSTGVDDVPWTADSNQEDAHFGTSVASAGDVNRDGYSDIIIGAPDCDGGETGEGRAYVFEGSASGLPAAANWTEERNQLFEHFGCSVASAGDVNGDGYSDVIVGAESFDGSHVDEGRAWIYRGSASGLLAGASWSNDIDQDGAQMGHVVAGAGDVNGDGYSDVIVGANLWDGASANQGGAWVYLGAPVGMATTAAWSTEIGQASALIGGCVAGAGDVNGDGFSDVVVGADLWDNGNSEEGRVFLYFGNGGLGLDHAARQARADGTVPIDVLGRTDDAGAFRLRALGRTAAGRGNVRMEWEVQPLGTPFNGSALQSSGSELDTGAPGAGGSAIAFDELTTAPSLGVSYCWRVRFRSDSPFFPRGPWLTLPHNAGSEADLRTPPSSVDVPAPLAAVDGLRLERSWPNPFVHQASIAYSLPARAHVHLRVFDAQGRCVARLVDEVQAPGPHVARWEGVDRQGDAPPGAYFVRLESGGAMRGATLRRIR